MKQRPDLTTIYGTDLPDLIDMSASVEALRMIGYGGADTLIGGSGADDIRGNNGSDSIEGGAGNDTLYGGGTNDLDPALDAAHGPDGNDLLKGGGGRDLIAGGQGDDSLIGGAGADTLYGGAGADTFIWRGADSGDVVMDFEQGIDVIDLPAGAAWSSTASGGTTTLTADMNGDGATDLWVTLMGEFNLGVGDVM